MSHRGSDSGTEEIAAESGRTGGEDRFSALPDVLLQDILSSLPADEAVRTSVLARGWRGLWKSTPVLRLAGAAAGRWRSPERFNDFVNNLLLFRDRSPLCEMALISYPFEERGRGHNDEPFRFVGMWIRYALMCDVQVLRVRVRNGAAGFTLPAVATIGASLVSRHLKVVVELERVFMEGGFEDLSRCPALEELTIISSRFDDDDDDYKLSFQSLKRLSIVSSDFSWWSRRTLIDAPSLVSLRLEDVEGWTPLLGGMPFLVTSFIKLGTECEDCCPEGRFRVCRDHRYCGNCRGPDGTRGGDKAAVVLGSLSNASNLELIAAPGVSIFNRDLKWLPMFGKLKTLLLNEWCLQNGLHAVACFIQHAPVLEKLTLQFYELRYKVNMKVIQEQQLPPPEHLKVVEIRCLKIDGWIHRIVKILNTFKSISRRLLSNCKLNLRHVRCLDTKFLSFFFWS